MWLRLIRVTDQLTNATHLTRECACVRVGPCPNKMNKLIALVSVKSLSTELMAARCASRCLWVHVSLARVAVGLGQSAHRAQ